MNLTRVLFPLLVPAICALAVSVAHADGDRATVGDLDPLDVTIQVLGLDDAGLEAGGTLELPDLASDRALQASDRAADRAVQGLSRATAERDPPAENAAGLHGTHISESARDLVASTRERAETEDLEFRHTIREAARELSRAARPDSASVREDAGAAREEANTVAETARDNARNPH